MLKGIFNRRSVNSEKCARTDGNSKTTALANNSSGYNINQDQISELESASSIAPTIPPAISEHTGRDDVRRRPIELPMLDFTPHRRLTLDHLASPDTPCSYSSFAERLNLFLHADTGDAGEDVSMPSDFLSNNLGAFARAAAAAAAAEGDESRAAALAAFASGQGMQFRRSLGQQSGAGDKDDKSTKSKWKKRAKIILPHVGLVLISILYTVLGAVIFYAVERPYEVDQKQQSMNKIQDFKKRFAYEMWALSQNGSHIDEPRWTKIVDDELEDLMRTLHVAFTEHHVTMDDILLNLTEHTVKWSFSASLFFSATVITTIGYGHLVPQTQTGQIICIGFALIGIPLILVTIADMGKFLSIYVIKIYKFYATYSHMIKTRLLRLFRRIQRRYVALKARRAASRGLGATAATNHAGTGIEDEAGQVPGTSAAEEEEEESMDRLEEQFTDMEDTISATFLILILVGYTALGAALLPLWEKGKEWNYFGAFYYCFITVTTIGFGDIVPENQTFILATITYIVLGLIITTMCIDLVGSTYIRDLHFFGRNVKQMLARQMLARQGLIQFGGKVVNLSDVFGYVAFLQKSFGVTPEQLNQMAMLPEDYLLQCLVHGRQPNVKVYYGDRPFIPNDIYYIKWIEQPRTLSFTSERVLASLESLSLDVTSRCSTVRTPREWYYHMIMEHMKDTKI